VKHIVDVFGVGTELALLCLSPVETDTEKDMQRENYSEQSDFTSSTRSACCRLGLIMTPWTLALRK